MTYSDWSVHLLAAKKGLANAEAAAALHKWDLAAGEAWRAMDACALLMEWFQVMEKNHQAQLPLDIGPKQA